MIQIQNNFIMSLKVVFKISCVIFICGLVILWSKTSRNLDIIEVFNDTCSTNGSVNEPRRRMLSRSKRFLVFPEGSSLQLVFCVQTAALIPIGDIFLFGSTAALAWNLPTDPKLLLMLKENEKNGQRRVDESNVYYLDDKGKLIAKVPYKRRTIINPAFAKRSTNEKTTFKEKLKIKIDRTKMHARQSDREYLKKNNLDHDSIEFHRYSRVDLYEKLVPFITALGGDGRQCVLRKLCEAAKAARQGTFLQEMLRVVFTVYKIVCKMRGKRLHRFKQAQFYEFYGKKPNPTANQEDVQTPEAPCLNKSLPKGREFQAEEHRDYDKAHSVRDDCASLYPGCDQFDVPVQFNLK